MITCPHCNSVLNLEQLTEDGAARQFIKVLAQIGCAAEVIAYLGLFKPRKQALRWTRALALAEELRDRWPNDPRLRYALVNTLESLREKRQEPTWKPLTNHSYLAKVIDSTQVPPSAAAQLAPPEKTRERSLEQDLNDTDWAKR